MDIDGITLADLQVFSEGDGRGGVSGLFERAGSIAARHALHRRLRSPYSDIEELKAAQDAVRFFDKGWVGPLLPDGLLDAVGRYLASNIDLGTTGTLHRDALNSLWLRVRERELCRELRSGLGIVAELLRQGAPLIDWLLERDPPMVVRTLATRAKEQVQALSGVDVSRSLLQVIRTDRRVRVQSRGRLVELVDCLAELQALRVMGATTRTQGWTYPEFVEGERFRLEGVGLFHPFIDGAMGNPVDIVGGEPVVFLTGPNMAGKTTYLRSVGLAVLLAQMGMGVPAKSLRLTPVDVLLTGLNPSDNLRAGLSFFFAEVTRVREAAEQLVSGRRCLVMFDEVFKGTNVKDALEASLAVIAGFSKSQRSGSVFSSHLVELAEPLSALGRVRFAFFDGEVVEGRATYSYRLKPGVSDQRLGLQLLEEANVPALLGQIGTP